MDSSDEEIDMTKPISVNKPVDRMNIKSHTIRVKQQTSRAKEAAHQKLREEKKMAKDIERLENLMK